MKTLIASLLFVSSAAFAGEQSIVCKSVKPNGPSISVQVVYNQDKSVSTARSTAELGNLRSGSFGDIMVSSVSEGKNIYTENKFSTVFMSPMHDYFYDIQLQFKQHIKNKNFRNVEATFAIGDDGSSSEGWGNSWDVNCNSYVK